MSEEKKPEPPATSDAAIMDEEEPGEKSEEVEYGRVECTDTQEELAEETEEVQDAWGDCILVEEDEGLTNLEKGTDDEEEDESYGVVEEVMQRALILTGERLSFHPFFDKNDRIEYTKEELDVGGVPEPRDPRRATLQRISTVKVLKEAIKELKKVTEIGLALFLNENNYHQEITYLLISIDKADYCIDVNGVGEHLNLLVPIFLDPKITKIMRRVPDCLWWLQEEQGLFVANLFDLDVGLAFVPDALPELKCQLGKFNLKIHPASAMIRFGNHSTQQKIASNNFYLLTWTHFNVYLYRMIKKSILDQFGVGKYLKIKHAMDNFCRLQHVNRHEVLRGRLLHNQRRNQEVQRKALWELYIWRQNVATAENIKPHEVLTADRLLKLATLPSSDVSLIRSNAESEYVEQNMAEVYRILNGSQCTTVHGKSLEFHITNGLPKSANAKPGNDFIGGAKRNQPQAGPGGPSSAVKRQKLQQYRAPHGNLRNPKQQGGRGAFQYRGPKTSYNTNPKGSEQTSRGGYRSNSQDRGSFRGNRESFRGGSFRNSSDRSRRDSGNFRESRGDSGNTRGRSTGFVGSRNRSSGFRGGGRSFSNRSSSGNFNRSSDSFSRNSPRNSWQSSDNVGPRVWNVGSSTGSVPFSGSFGNSSGNFGNVVGGSSSGNFGQTPTHFGGNIDVETVIIDKQIELLKKQLQMKRMRQMLNQFN